MGNNREALTFGQLRAAFSLNRHMTNHTDVSSSAAFALSADSSFLASFFQEAEGKSPQEIATLLAADDRIDEAHGSAANEGQSEQTGEDVVCGLDPLVRFDWCKRWRVV